MIGLVEGDLPVERAGNHQRIERRTFRLRPVERLNRIVPARIGRIGLAARAEALDDHGQARAFAQCNDEIIVLVGQPAGCSPRQKAYRSCAIAADFLGQRQHFTVLGKARGHRAIIEIVVRGRQRS